MYLHVHVHVRSMQLCAYTPHTIIFLHLPEPFCLWDDYINVYIVQQHGYKLSGTLTPEITIL